MDQTLPWFLGRGGLDALIAKKHYVVLDFENTILPGFATNKSNHLVLACWYVVRDGVVQKKWRFADEYALQELHSDLDAADFMVAHNAKYEAEWLLRSGYDLRTLLTFCTQTGEWVLLGNNPKRLAIGLDDVALRRLGEHKDQLGKSLIRDWGVCPSVTPRSWLLRYCMQDVDLTYRIFLQQHEELTHHNLWHIALSRNLVIPVLADIELQGLQLDAAKVYAEYERQLEICETAALALDQITGGINLNSRPQVAALLYDKLGFQEARDVSGNRICTDSGARSTSEEAILRLQPETEEQTTFLLRYKEYVKASTLLSKTLTFLKKVCDYNGGVFYGTINQGRTGTHRLASGGMEMLFPGDRKTSKVQLQNIPRQYKKMFVAHDPDYEVREDDGAQLEFRVAAELGHDRQALLDIDNGEDIHASTRQVMRDANHPNFIGLNDKEARQEAKPFTFQPLYGGRGNHPAEHAYADFWAKKYPDIYREQERWCMQVVADKYLITPYGMKFYWPNAKMFNSGRTNVRTEVFNYPVQGFATAEIIPIALVYYWHRAAGLRVQIFNTVHDSIISRVHKEDQAAVDAVAKQALTYDVYHFLREVYQYEFCAPLGVGSKVGSYWGAGIEKVWDVWPDGRERYQEKD
jgi:DNA polymerase I-like protein with 3'-5' exonuclease and polymerase domains